MKSPKLEAAALRRLKQRIAIVVPRWYLETLTDIIDAWHAAERKRGGR